MRLVLLLGLAVTAWAAPAAMKINLAEKGFQAVVNSDLPPIVARIQGLKAPDVSGSKDSISYHVTNIVLQRLTYGSATVNLARDLSFTISGVGIHVTLSWEYRENIWPHLPNGKGTADVTTSGVALTVAVSAGIDAAGRPVLHADTVACELGGLNIAIHGSILSWFYDIIIGLFKGSIKKAIETAVEADLKNMLQAEANKVLATLILRYPVDATNVLDYRLTNAVVFSNRYMQLDFEAAIVPVANPVPPNLPRSTMPFAPSGRMLDIQLDAYTFNSGFYAYFVEGKLQHTVMPQDVPATSLLKLNTSDFRLLVPNLYAAYPNRAMMLKIASPVAPTLALSPSEQVVKAPFFVAVYAQNPAGAWVQAFTVDIPATAAFRARITGATGRLSGDIDKFALPLTVHNSTIGPVDFSGISGLMGLGINIIILPFVNSILEKGVPLPEAKGLELVNPTLKFGVGYFDIQTDIHFTPF